MPSQDHPRATIYPHPCSQHHAYVRSLILGLVIHLLYPAASVGMDHRGPVQRPWLIHPSGSIRLHGAIRNIVTLSDGAHDPPTRRIRSIIRGGRYRPGIHEEGWVWVPFTGIISATHAPGEIIGDPTQAPPAFPCTICSYGNDV